MTTNLTIFPVDGPAVLYFQDGSSITVAAQETKQVQVIEGGVCTISDPPPDQDEHMPPGTAFAEAMIAFWDMMRDKFRKAAQQQPTVNPL